MLLTVVMRHHGLFLETWNPLNEASLPCLCDPGPSAELAVHDLSVTVIAQPLKLDSPSFLEVSLFFLPFDKSHGDGIISRLGRQPWLAEIHHQLHPFMFFFLRQRPWFLEDVLRRVVFVLGVWIESRITRCCWVCVHCSRRVKAQGELFQLDNDVLERFGKTDKQFFEIWCSETGAL